MRLSLKNVSGGSAQGSHGLAGQLAGRFVRATEPERRRIYREAEKAAAAHTETTVVPINGKRNALHLMLTDSAACYLATEHNGKAAWETMPPAGFVGLLASDGGATFSAYGLLHQLCLAHLTRELKGVSLKEPDRTWHLKMREHLQLIMHERRTMPTPMGEEELNKWAEHHEKVYDEICTLGTQEYEWMPPSENCRGGLNVLSRMMKRRDDILYFLRHPRVPYTNNDCERGLRPVKRKTKAGVTWRVPGSLEDYAAYLTVTRSAKLHGRDVFTVLRDTLEQDYCG